jgi:hypothetical protein
MNMQLNEKQLAFIDRWIKTVLNIHYDYEILDIKEDDTIPVIRFRFKDEFGIEYVDSTGVPADKLNDEINKYKEM